MSVVPAGAPSAAREGAVKHAMIEELGAPGLLLPSLVNRGLEANDRAKYLLSLLQAARAHAVDPTAPLSSLRDERLAAGVVDDELDGVVASATRVGDDACVIPGLRELHGALVDAVAEMLEPLATDGSPRIDPARLAALVQAAPDLAADRVDGGYIDRITSGDPAHGDSFHVLIMDAHRALNRLQAEVATETLDGAAVYHLADNDRPLVSAFMAGVHATSPLKFEHPGLGTTATRAGGRLVIQNDIGQTAAHVLVLTVEGLMATVTYTDVHLKRVQFFESMLDRFPVQWSDQQHRQGAVLGEHHLVTGRYVAVDRTALAGYLQHIGSRLVFLIDWNKARKRLIPLVGKQDAVGLLHWAAEADCGHMAFLLLGGERLIYDAVELAAKVPARYGEPLRDVLGNGPTLDVLRFALRASSEGLRSGKSQLLIRDELRVEVLRHVQAAHSSLLAAAAEHGSLIVEAAQTLRTALLRLGTSEGADFIERASLRVAGWEHRADEILGQVRLAASRVEGGSAVADLLTISDDAIDDLEEAVFLLTLLPAEATDNARRVLDNLAGVAVAAAQEHLKALLIAGAVVAGASAEDLEDFLVAVDRVMTLEHDADRADRAARAALVAGVPDFRSLHVADTLSRQIENATDALLRSALGLRDHLLREVTP